MYMYFEANKVKIIGSIFSYKNLKSFSNMYNLFNFLSVTLNRYTIYVQFFFMLAKNNEIFTKY